MSTWSSKNHTSHFSQGQREELMHDDLTAGFSVALVLAAVITVGAVLMLGTVIYTL